MTSLQTTTIKKANKTNFYDCQSFQFAQTQYTAESINVLYWHFTFRVRFKVFNINKLQPTHSFSKERKKVCEKEKETFKDSYKKKLKTQLKW